MEEMMQTLALGLKKAEKKEDGSFEAKITKEELEKAIGTENAGKVLGNVADILLWRTAAESAGKFCFTVISNNVNYDDGVLQISFLATSEGIISVVQGKAPLTEEYKVVYRKSEYALEDLLKAAADLNA